MAETGGAATPRGAATAEKNVPAEKAGGVQPRAARIRATLDAEGLRVVIVASAAYAGTTPKGRALSRLATTTYEVPTTGVDTDLKRILRSLLDGHAQDAQDQVLEHAYEARAQARRAGEIV